MAPDDLTHRDLLAEIARLGGKVDLIHSLVAERKEDISRLSKAIDDLFGRQRQLEFRLAWLAGVGAVVVLAVPLAVSWFSPDVIIREQTHQERQP